MREYIRLDTTLTVDELLAQWTLHTLRFTQGNRTEAAKRMGISIRTLRNWIHRYQLKEIVPTALTGLKSKNRK